MENKAGRQEKRKLDSSSRADRIEQALFTTYHKTIWGPFTKAIRGIAANSCASNAPLRVACPLVSP